MTKERIIPITKALPLPAGSFWLVMGAALVMHGVKPETNDIDIGCTTEAFGLLLDQGYPLSISKSGLRKITIGDHVTVYEDFPTDRIVYLNGIAISDLASIRKVKSVFGRKKDMIDIELIDHFLVRNKT